MSGLARNGDATSRATHWVAILVTTASGVAGLGFEVVWTQQLGFGLGHELVAVLAVLAAFFGGIALGAYLLARAIEKSERPVRWYAACELVIAAWAFLLSFAMPRAAELLATCIGAEPSAFRHWSVAFLGTFVLLLPATFAIGATLPAIERVIMPARSDGSAIGWLYAANTFGAVCGALGCTFGLIPALGLADTARTCAVLNLICAAVGFAYWRAQIVPLDEPVHSGPPASRLSTVLFATGALGIGYEVVVVRVLSQINENTVYTFAILLGVYLFGTAIGGALHRRSAAAWSSVRDLRERLLAAVAAACLIGAAMSWSVRWWKPALTSIASNALGGVGAAWAGETAAALATLLPPTAAMGLLFSQLCSEAKVAGFGFGRALAANTMGASIAPFLFGVLLVPWFGSKLVLIVVAVGYIALAAPDVWQRSRLRVPLASVTAAALAMLVGLPALRIIDLPAGGTLAHYADGVTASVSVIEDADGVATLRINNRQQEGSSATLLNDARQAWLPLLLHPNPQSGLFLGLGTGITAGSAAWDPALAVDAVELLPEVVVAAAGFSPLLGTDHAPNVHVSDARRFVRATGPGYDVIVADLYQPARSGSGALYTVEHFAAVRGKLARGGLFCQWLPLHQLDLPTLRSIIASYRQVFPDAMAVLATNSLDTPVFGLVARPGGTRYSFQVVQARIADVSRAGRLASLNLDDAYAVLGGFIAGPAALRRFSAGAPLNTDDRPVVAHLAPFATYAPASSARERLVTLVRALDVQPDEVLPNEPLERARLAAYRAARARFIELGTRVWPSDDARDMLAQIGQPLLEIVRLSPDFRPAYDPLVNMAAALATSDSGRAQVLLSQLMAAQPTRPEAGRLLQQLAALAPPARDP